MTTISAGRAMSNHGRVLAALGTAAVGVGTVVVGAHLIDATRPASDTAPYLPAAVSCLQPVANPLAPNRSEPLAVQEPTMWKPGLPCGPVFTWDTARPSDPMPVLVDASSRLNPV
jgi:hypothetical protein